MTPRRPPANPWPGRIVATLVALALLWFVFGVYAAGQPLWALGLLVFGVTALYVYAVSTSVWSSR